MNTIRFKNFLFLLLMIVIQPLAAESQSSVEFRSAAFFPGSGLFRELYGNAGACYQLEVGTPLECYNLDLFANVDWFSKRGRTEAYHSRTRIQMATISLGVKYIYSCGCFNPYIGIGPSFSRVWLQNHLHCGGCNNVSRWSVGGVIKTGINWTISNCLFLDFFADWSYQPPQFKSTTGVGGFRTGLGIGSKF